MKIAQIVASVDPRNGGPSVSVPRLARALSERGHEVDLLSTHAYVDEPVTRGSLTTRVFSQAWPPSVCRSPDLAGFLKHQKFDVLHSNGLWLRPLHYADEAARRHDVPHVLAPRGMMNAWAWNHHRLKKALADRLLHPGALQSVSGFHATSRAEAEDIRRLGFTQPICIAPNGIDRPLPAQEDMARQYWRKACPEALDRPTALFYSRFHCKKRLIELIDLWIEEAPPDWLLLIVGFPEEYSVAQLNEYILRNNGAGSIIVFDGTGAPAPYPVASLFLLPSLTENFGMVVAEALAHGLPVLVTDTTPWESINATEFGWCGPWEQFRGALHDALALGHKTLRKRGADARDWAVTEFSWDRSAMLLNDFYSTLTR